MLATREALKQYMGIGKSDVSQGRLLDNLLTVASEIIEEHCGRGFERAEVKEYLDGAGTPELVLSRRPVTKLYGVWIDTVSEDGGTWFAPHIEVVLHRDSGIAERPDGVFPRGKKNVLATYAAGYETIPDDLASACVKLAAQMYTVSDLSAEVEALVAPYKERVPK